MPASSLWSWLKIPVYLSSALVSVGSGALYYYQNEIIYPRNLPPGTRTEVPRPSQMGLPDSEELQIPTPDGETLSAFLIKPSNKSLARPITIISFHGNAGNIGHRLPVARVLVNDLQCTVFMLEYRGYGLSSGNPNEKGLAIDAQTGLDYIRQRSDLKDHQTIIYGQSLGGAVSIDLVAKNRGTGDIKGLILENTFLSIAKMIPKAVPVAKFMVPLCHEYWKSEEIIPQITDIPVLFLSGLKDEIVPYVVGSVVELDEDVILIVCSPSHMKQLFRLCRSRAIVWQELPNGDHNSTVAEPGYFMHIENFLRKYILR